MHRQRFLALRLKRGSLLPLDFAQGQARRLAASCLAVLASALLAIPALALAYTPMTLTVDLGTSIAQSQLFANIVRTFAAVAILLCGVLFVVGAVFMVGSRGKEDQLNTGKELMIKSMIGLAVVGGAYGIIRTLYYVIYGS